MIWCRERLGVLVESMRKMGWVTLRKKKYCVTIDSFASIPRLLGPVADAGTICFSIRAHVKYTSKRSNRMPRRIMLG